MDVSSTSNTGFQNSISAETVGGTLSPPTSHITQPEVEGELVMPVTTEVGETRTRVYLACNEWSVRIRHTIPQRDYSLVLITCSRVRRRRCDGAKPICQGCRRRHPNLEQCDYEPEAKRRGKDKIPKARMRSKKGHRAPRRSQQQILDDLNIFRNPELDRHTGDPSVQSQDPTSRADVDSTVVSGSWLLLLNALIRFILEFPPSDRRQCFRSANCVNIHTHCCRNRRWGPRI